MGTKGTRARVSGRTGGEAKEESQQGRHASVHITFGGSKQGRQQSHLKAVARQSSIKFMNSQSSKGMQGSELATKVPPTCITHTAWQSVIASPPLLSRHGDP